MNLILAGDIKDESSKHYDELFPNLMVKNLDGQNVVIPLSRDCSISFIKEATQEEIDKIMDEAKKRREAGQGSSLLQPGFSIPRGKGRR